MRKRHLLASEAKQRRKIIIKNIYNSNYSDGMNIVWEFINLLRGTHKFFCE